MGYMEARHLENLKAQQQEHKAEISKLQEEKNFVEKKNELLTLENRSLNAMMQFMKVMYRDYVFALYLQDLISITDKWWCSSRR